MRLGIKSVVLALSVVPFAAGAAMAEGCSFSRSVKAPEMTTIAEADKQKPVSQQVILPAPEATETDVAEKRLSPPVAGS